MNVRLGLGRLSWLVPVVVLAQLAGVSGARTADACSGGAPQGGWNHLRVAISTGEDRLPIASDGFVVVRGAYVTDDANAEVPLPWVRATNEAGAELSGKLKVLRTENYEPGMLLVYMGWQADEPLAKGSVVQLSLAEAIDEAGAGGASNGAESYETVKLEVVGEPTPLPVPKAELGDWVEVRHGVGALVDCFSHNSCDTIPLRVPTEEERVPGVTVQWTLPSITGSVAWEVWAETSDPSDAALPPTLTPPQLIEREPIVSTLNGHSVKDLVAFANDASEACAVVVVRDLRTGQELRSSPQCEEPGAVTATFVDHALGSCDEPPTPESTKLWCASLSDLARADEDDPGNNHCEGIGPGGMAGAGATGTGSDSEEQDAVAEPRTSSSCRYSAATGSVWFGATAIGLGLLASARRRSRRHTCRLIASHRTADLDRSCLAHKR